MLEKMGIGIDTVDVKRFEDKPFENNMSFYKKLFHMSEINYCLKHTNPAQYFAAKFAIKESVVKSITIQVEFLNILTDHANSKPTVVLIDDTSYAFLVSVSHEKSHVVAVVISEKI